MLARYIFIFLHGCRQGGGVDASTTGCGDTGQDTNT
jgi:hypothetical protein